jgi:hypothetical protein
MARSFNGSTDHIQTGSYTVSTPAISLCAWFNRGTLSNTYNVIASQNLTGHIQIMIKSTGQMAYYLSVTGEVLDPGSATVSANTWTHVGMTYNSTNGLVTYINGVSDGTVSAGGSLSSITAPMDIGYDDQNPGRDFPGSIADVAQWGVSLSALEVAGLAKGARPYQVRPSSLTGWWPLAGLQSPEPDYSGNKNNGTLTGTAPIFGPPLGLATTVARGRNLMPALPTIVPVYAVAGFAYSEW